MPVLINSRGVAGSGSGCSPDAVTLPMEADNGEPGKVGKVQRREPNKIASQVNGSVKVGERQNPQVRASDKKSIAPSIRQHKLEATIASKRVSPTSMAAAQTILT